MQITAQNLSGGVFVSSMIPFAQDGEVLFDDLGRSVDMIRSLTGILGIAINTTERERLCLTTDERLEVIRRTRAALSKDQLLLSCVGELSSYMIEDLRLCQMAGADAVIAFPGTSYQSGEDASFQHFSKLVDKMPLPVIVTLGHGDHRWSTACDQLTALAASNDKIVGFDMGSGDNVLQYDQEYYAIKSLDRPIACLSSSDGVLFHNLNTGGDGALSCLGAIAPHEVTRLYLASRAGCFSEAQAIHNQLAPLIALLNGHDDEAHELLYREAAFHRGLLASPHARGITETLCPDLRNELHKTIADIGIKIAC